MAHRKGALNPLNNAVSADRSLLNFRPKIDFIEPNQIPDDRVQQTPASLQSTIDQAYDQLTSIMEGYARIEEEANLAQARIDDLAKDVVVNLDENQDAHIIAAIKRHLRDSVVAEPEHLAKENPFSGDQEDTIITFSDYRKCIDTINQNTLTTLVAVSEEDIKNASSDPYKTQFGSLGMKPGLARPDLNPDFQIIKPLDLKKFTRDQLIELNIRLLETMLGGPVSGIVKRVFKKLLKHLKKKRAKTKANDNTTTTKGRSVFDSQRLLNDLDIANANAEKFLNSTVEVSPTQIQDCNVIVDAFEKGAHFSHTEGSVYAPLTRQVQTQKIYSQSMQRIMSTYRLQSSIGRQDESSENSDEIGLDFGDIHISLGDTKKIEAAIKKCIPCSFRISQEFELLPSWEDGFKTAFADLEARGKTFEALKDLFGNWEFYADICHMADFLNEMCLADLQRIIAILAAMLTEHGLALSTVFNLITKLVAPLFAPILMSLVALLDQFYQLIVRPIDCVIVAIHENLRRLTFAQEVNFFGLKDTLVSNPSGAMETTDKLIELRNQMYKSENNFITGMAAMATQLDFASAYFITKIDFYTAQMNKFLAMTGGHDISYINTASQKLATIRLIEIVVSIIRAKTEGGGLCAEGEKPGPEDLNRFFAGFINPTGKRKIYVAPNGDVVIEEPNAPGVPNNTTSNKDAAGNALNDSKKTGNAKTDNVVTQPDLIANKYSPKKTVFKCKFKTSQEDVNKVNTWIAELDQIRG